MLLAGNFSQFCNETAELLQFIGYALLIIKIGIPLVIILLGVIDFGRAVVAEKDDEIKSRAKRLLWRVIAGIIIFFVPNIVIWVFSLVNEYSTNSNDFKNCRVCLTRPKACEIKSTDE